MSLYSICFHYIWIIYTYAPKGSYICVFLCSLYHHGIYKSLESSGFIAILEYGMQNGVVVCVNKIFLEKHGPLVELHFSMWLLKGAIEVNFLLSDLYRYPKKDVLLDHFFLLVY